MWWSQLLHNWWVQAGISHVLALWLQYVTINMEMFTFASDQIEECGTNSISWFQFWHKDDPMLHKCPTIKNNFPVFMKWAFTNKLMAPMNNWWYGQPMEESTKSNLWIAAFVLVSVISPVTIAYVYMKNIMEMEEKFEEAKENMFANFDTIKVLYMNGNTDDIGSDLSQFSLQGQEELLREQMMMASLIYRMDFLEKQLYRMGILNARIYDPREILDKITDEAQPKQRSILTAWYTTSLPSSHDTCMLGR